MDTRIVEETIIDIEVVEHNSSAVSMYDFEVEDNHNYFANGILTHNSEHVPMLCVDGESSIRCKDECGNEISLLAKDIYDKIGNHEDVYIHTFNEDSGELEYKKVMYGYKQDKDLYNVMVDNGNNLTISLDHPLFHANDGFKSLRDIRVGDPILLLNNDSLESVKISSINLAGPRDAYDFVISDNHNFFANGFLVHNCIDEVDVVQDPRALREAQMIPSTFGEYFPLTVYLSTRKFAGGLMEKTLKKTIESGGEVLRWNILDVTERISHEEAKVDEPRQIRYISRNLPMESLKEDEYNSLPDEKKNNYERLEAYAGIADHPMLPVMKNYLVDRPQDHTGGLYKKLSATLNNFRQLDSDMAEAQLLCNKPSAAGLVFPKFDNKLNSITIDQAYSQLLGEECSDVSYNDLIKYCQDLGLEFFGGMDFGHVDETSLIVGVKLSIGDFWIVDMISAPGLEIDEICEFAEQLSEKYDVKKWFCDSAYPAYVKKLNKVAGVKAIGVEKGPGSVKDGITAVQSMIVTGMNKRFLKILDTKNTERIKEAFGTYSWKKDGKGDPIDGVPEHGNDGTADIMDSLRYLIYSLFGKGSGKVLFSYDLEKDVNKNNLDRIAEKPLQAKVDQLTGRKNDLDYTKNSDNNSKEKNGIVWSF